MMTTPAHPLILPHPHRKDVLLPCTGRDEAEAGDEVALLKQTLGLLPLFPPNLTPGLQQAHSIEQ